MMAASERSRRWRRAGLPRLISDERGSSAVEFALVLPAFLLLIFGAIGGGVLAYATTSLQRATEVASRCVTLQGSLKCADASAITTAGTNAYSGPFLSSLSFTATPAASCANKVTGTGTFSAFPGLNFLTVNLSASACYPGP